MRNSTVPVLFVLLMISMPVTLAAQAKAQSRPESVKLDEYGQIRGCDHSARLDNLAIEIEKNPGSKAYVVAYAPEARGALILDIIRNYLVNSRGISTDLIKTIYGGRNSRTRFQSKAIQKFRTDWKNAVTPPTAENVSKSEDTTRFSGVEFQLRPNQSHSDC